VAAFRGFAGRSGATHAGGDTCLRTRKGPKAY
jgi:hypothetical protein